MKGKALSREKQKEIRRKMLPQFIYIVAVFVPFILILVDTFDVFDKFVTLSRVGWRVEVGGDHGWIFLVAFVVLSAPFMAYQMWFYLKHSGRWKSGGKFGGKFLLGLTLLAGILIAVGCAIPFYNINDPRASQLAHDLHNSLAMIGSLLAVAAVTIALIQVAREKHMQTIMILYTVFCVSVYWAYSILKNAVAFEVGLAFTIFIFMYFINRTELYRAAKKSKRQADTSDKEKEKE